MQLAILDNKIAEGNYKENNKAPIKMFGLREDSTQQMIGEPTERGMCY
jgi:hypothetical protein